MIQLGSDARVDAARISLEQRGWASFGLPMQAEFSCDQLLSIAAQFGTPVPSRHGSALCDALVPVQSHEAKPRSLSRANSVGAFPLHADMAHWLVPCRHVVLACVSPGSTNRPTFLLDTRRLPLDKQKTSLLHSAPFRVRNGRNSFFSTILSKTRSFVRCDPGCMEATTPQGEAALKIFSKCSWPGHVEAVRWLAGAVLVIDNWRVLHGRGEAAEMDADRKLLRVCVR